MAYLGIEIVQYCTHALYSCLIHGVLTYAQLDFPSVGVKLVLKVAHGLSE